MKLGVGLVLLFGAAACGGKVTDLGGGDTPSSGSGGSAGQSGSAGRAGRSGTGGGSSGVSGSGSGGTTPIPDEAMIEMGPFEVAPGVDTYRCQNFSNPFGGEVEIAEFETHMTEGSHHLILNYMQGSSTPAPEPCGGLEAPSGPFATQARDDKLTYPAGVAAPLAANQGLRINSHYFNTTTRPFDARIAVILRRAPEGSVRAEARSTVSIVFGINVPPHQSGSASGQITLGQNAQLISVLPHMHWHGTRFVVQAGNQQIFETDNWETPPHQFNPPFPLTANQALDFSCEYYNNENVALTFGESAATNEMCVLVAQYYR